MKRGGRAAFLECRGAIAVLLKRGILVVQLDGGSAQAFTVVLAQQSGELAAGPG